MILKSENSNFKKKLSENPAFKTDFAITMEKGKMKSASKNKNESIISKEVLKELERLGINKIDTYTKEKYFTLEDGDEEEACIPVELVQLLWGYQWVGIDLEWKELPNCEEYDDKEEEDNEFDAEYRNVVISYGFYLDESFSIENDVYMVIGACEVCGQEGRISICLSDENMSDPKIYFDDYESGPNEYGSLGNFLKSLSTKKVREGK